MEQENCDQEDLENYNVLGIRLSLRKLLDSNDQEKIGLKNRVFLYDYPKKVLGVGQRRCIKLSKAGDLV